MGVSRLVGALIEAFHDDDGCKWPASVAPFHAGILSLKAGDEACDGACDQIYQALAAKGFDVLYDDTNARGGEKFARMDLIGLPYQIIVGPRGLKNGVVEVKRRSDGEREELSIEAAIANVGDALTAALA